MRVSSVFSLIAVCWTVAATPSTQGLYDLVKRRLPSHCEDFVFFLDNSTAPSNSTGPGLDEYAISTLGNGSIAIEGSSLSALATGLRRYLTDVAHVDIHWFIGSRLDEAASPLPRPNSTISGKSIVPWRYYFNTVTFSYTTPFYTWTDWELELDWLALHGVNLPLAWVGFEQILLDVFRDIGLTDSEIIPFFSGPAFQAWNRFGNIQGSWNGSLPLSFIASQSLLQQQILARMLSLGMTPILPAFTGFVPRALTSRFPSAAVVNGSRWEDFEVQYTNTTFLEPSDPLFAQLQEKVISKQIDAYGNITSFYTLDQYNENDPFSGDLDYLRNVTKGTWQSLKAANPAAVWVMQGWLFYSNADFWTTERISSYLSGVEDDSDMLVLDLFSESQPQWQRTGSYSGKPWVWNQLHNYGGNMGLYGQVDNVTINPIAALQDSPTMVGMGCTPEGQEGNEIIYKLLLDQAWSSTPINTSNYFRSWAQNRYAANNSIPEDLYTAWEVLRTSAYNNTNLTSNAVPKAIFELAPNITGLVGRTGHHPTTINYNPATVVSAWQHLVAASSHDAQLWKNPAYAHDVIDVTRQVFSNAFLGTYTALTEAWNTTAQNTTLVAAHVAALKDILTTLDTLLLTRPQFRLAPWLASARALARTNATDGAAEEAETETEAFFALNALNQVTLWGPTGEINDYASKSWGGLVGQYYLPRWTSFLDYLVATGPAAYDGGVARAGVKRVEEEFQVLGLEMGKREVRAVRDVVEGDVLDVFRGLDLL
ncbi:glycoside hydrolase family 89 protein [Melanomma pulvis-pyrius CBS 109.77]|uniref:Glycoside hydrolase family 89 protein n=1 Tax=Melanomma pulvis-pyrius CBS 109.77 TaxID=1314802 RepID=A0A6A6WYD0_9PLEO|nr:glycoside hydrolase family 89 protein [Melanomma pulvis-pyrius CBS 109.77]